MSVGVVDELLLVKIQHIPNVDSQSQSQRYAEVADLVRCQLELISFFNICKKTRKIVLTAFEGFIEQFWEELKREQVGKLRVAVGYFFGFLHHLALYFLVVMLELIAEVWKQTIGEVSDYLRCLLFVLANQFQQLLAKLGNCHIVEPSICLFNVIL